MKNTDVYDIDISFDGNNTFGVKWEENSDWDRIQMADYCEYLYSAGRIDGWDDERDGVVILEWPDESFNPGTEKFDRPGRRITYSFSGYLKEVGGDLERDLLAWKCAANQGYPTPAPDAWIEEVREPQPAGELVPEEFTPDQVSALAYEAGLYNTGFETHPNQKI